MSPVPLRGQVTIAGYNGSWQSTAMARKVLSSHPGRDFHVRSECPHAPSSRSASFSPSRTPRASLPTQSRPRGPHRGCGAAGGLAAGERRGESRQDPARRPGQGGSAGPRRPSPRAGGAGGGGPSPGLSLAATPRASSRLASRREPRCLRDRRRRMCGRWLLLLWALLPGAAAGGSGRTFPHHTVLDAEGKYRLSWGPRGARLAFRLEVRTAGYVGFGFSPTGAMAAADIVVGGVAQGRPYLQVSAPRSPSRPDPERARVPGPRRRPPPAALSPCARSPARRPAPGSEFSPREAEPGRLRAVFRF